MIAGRSSPTRTVRLAVSRRILLIVAALIVGACGSSTVTPSPGNPASPLASGAPGTSGPVATLAAGDLPAGVQFLSPALTLPLGFTNGPVAFGGKSLYFGSVKGALSVATVAGSSWNVATISDGHEFAPPPGLPHLMAFGWGVVSVASSAAGIAVAGQATFGDGTSTGASHSTREGALWFSSDGATWSMFDPRTLLGGGGESFKISDVMAEGTGFVAVGSLALSTNATKPDIIVLKSANGHDWSMASRVTATWSLDSGSLMSFKGSLLMSGWEYVCSTDAATHESFGVGAQLHIWQSTDAGTTWKDLPLAGAEPVLHVPAPAPADASGCPNPFAAQTVDTKYASHGFLLGVVADHVVALSPDQTTLAVSADLATWTTASLPGAAATGKTSSDALTRLITSDSSGWIFRAVQPRRDATGNELKIGYQVRWWRSTDSGATWTQGTPGNPLLVGGAFDSLVPAADGSVTLVVAPTSASGFTAQTVTQTSTSGPAVDWTHCTAAPNANCAFATTVTVAPGTKDLRGIDLIGANLAGVSLPGVDLTGARVYGATLDGDFSGANLSKLSFGGGKLSGKFDGANMAGDDLSGAAVSGSMTGANLTGAFFAGATVGADLSGANLSGATMNGATFSGANLAGATVTGVSWEGVSFDGTTVTCPDGKPSNPAAKGAAACRIKG
jgi:uncharacterized protein YjbI with pentapeptide repeats